MQVRVMVSLFVAVLLLPSCHKADSSGSVSDLTPPAEEPWKEFTSAEDAFIVFFPTIPEKKSQDNQYDFGKVTITAYTSHPKRNVVWRVAVHNYPEPICTLSRWYRMQCGTVEKQLLRRKPNGLRDHQ